MSSIWSSTVYVTRINTVPTTLRFFLFGKRFFSPSDDVTVQGVLQFLSHFTRYTYIKALQTGWTLCTLTRWDLSVRKIRLCVYSTCERRTRFVQIDSIVVLDALTFSSSSTVRLGCVYTPMYSILCTYIDIILVLCVLIRKHGLVGRRGFRAVY